MHNNTQNIYIHILNIRAYVKKILELYSNAVIYIYLADCRLNVGWETVHWYSIKYALKV